MKIHKGGAAAISGDLQAWIPNRPRRAERGARARKTHKAGSGPSKVERRGPPNKSDLAKLFLETCRPGFLIGLVELREVREREKRTRPGVDRRRSRDAGLQISRI